MPFVLRKIRKSKWDKHENVPWLGNGELQADAIGDLYTENNNLSVWLVTDDRSNLQRVAAALAATRDVISNLDYALLDVRLLADLNIKIEPTPGDSADTTAITSWHHNIIELSALRLMELANAIFMKGEIDRYSDRDIRLFVAQGIGSKQLDRAIVNLKPEAMAKIDELITLRKLDIPGE